GVDGKSVDLGSGFVIATRELVDKICTLMTTQIQPAYGAWTGRPLEPLRVANTEESHRLIDWAPRIQLAEGLRRTIDWYGRRDLGNAGLHAGGSERSTRSDANLTK